MSSKLIGYARTEARREQTGEQEWGILWAGVRRDDLYVDHGASLATAVRPEFDLANKALIAGDTLVITALDRLGQSTVKLLLFLDDLRMRGVGLRVLDFDGSDVDTSTPLGSMLFSSVAALTHMELEVKRERHSESIGNRRAAKKNLGGRPRRITDSQIRSALYLVGKGEPVAQVVRDFGMSRATFYRRAQTLRPA